MAYVTSQCHVTIYIATFLYWGQASIVSYPDPTARKHYRTYRGSGKQVAFRVLHNIRDDINQLHQHVSTESGKVYLVLCVN